MAHGIPASVSAVSSACAPGRGPRLPEQHVREQAATHADLAMDTPDRKLNAFLLERLMPRKHVMVDAVHQRSVEIKEKCHALGVR
jgi:hypothetical protein